MSHSYECDTFGMNATHEQVKTAPSFVEKHYIYNMKEVIETMPRIELALIIIGVFVLISLLSSDMP